MGWWLALLLAEKQTEGGGCGCRIVGKAGGAGKPRWLAAERGGAAANGRKPEEDAHGGGRREEAQRYSNKRIMHCSLCGNSSHRKSNCPTKNTAAASGQTEAPATHDEGEAPRKNTAPKKKTPKEVKRQKLQIKRPVRKLDSNGEDHVVPQTEEAVLTQTEEAVLTQTEEAVLTQTEEAVLTQTEEVVLTQIEEAVLTQEEAPIIPPKKKPVKPKFPAKIPKKKLPFVKNTDPAGKDFCLTGSKSKQLEANLRGIVGSEAVFVPTPGLTAYKPPTSSPPAKDLFP
ncbi:hypothetical protein POM88_054409 [Heracleum sosnowskyi]|uniref:Uncharacterized protein n=1 Tax=Heracleum sosnowskyi TaxID=360622 RepID=A0AAD8LW77_9APIA|nr:hypothetical protein POM88_054409 [Heracleum sosnowskyi]